MNENINLVEILKDAPKGTKLYSPICGECELYNINTYTNIIICAIKDDDDFSTLIFDSKGRYFGFSDSGEYMLFPSKDNRDWSTFDVPWKHKHFEPFQKVLVASGVSELWEPDIYGYYDNKRKRHICMIHSAYDNDIIPYEENEDKLGKSVK